MSMPWGQEGPVSLSVEAPSSASPRSMVTCPSPTGRRSAGGIVSLRGMDRNAQIVTPIAKGTSTNIAMTNQRARTGSPVGKVGRPSSRKGGSWGRSVTLGSHVRALVLTDDPPPVGLDDRVGQEALAHLLHLLVELVSVGIHEHLQVLPNAHLRHTLVAKAR